MPESSRLYKAILERKKINNTNESGTRAGSLKFYEHHFLPYSFMN